MGSWAGSLQVSETFQGNSMLLLCSFALLENTQFVEEDFLTQNFMSHNPIQECLFISSRNKDRTLLRI